MPTQANPSLTTVDWSRIPAPNDDGAARHLAGMAIADIALHATDGSNVSLARLSGRTVVFAYPRTGQPGKLGLVDDWDQIPGARGCTPQSCAFRDQNRDILAAGADRLYGLSTQDTAYQREAVDRLHLPFPLLSDADLAFTHAMRLPTMSVAGQTLLKRMSWIVDDGRITAVQYPVFPPDRNAADVLAWLAANPRTRS
ncbi:MAG TPA: peroxiredoxin [Hyphomicrobiaceae bacterium]|nr:peroxiredoxin [Hyphomicrobiaceae bacterium]